MLAMRLNRRIKLDWQRLVSSTICALLLSACFSCGVMGGGGSNGGGIPPFSLYWSVAVADLNGDGLPDIATTVTYFASATNQTGSVAVYLQNPSHPGTFLPATK